MVVLGILRFLSPSGWILVGKAVIIAILAYKLYNYVTLADRLKTQNKALETKLNKAKDDKQTCEETIKTINDYYSQMEIKKAKSVKKRKRLNNAKSDYVYFDNYIK